MTSCSTKMFLNKNIKIHESKEIRKCDKDLLRKECGLPIPIVWNHFDLQLQKQHCIITFNVLCVVGLCALQEPAMSVCWD